VSASGKRWHAYISYGGKQHSLGIFDTKQEAALAYDRAARECGEEKRLNYESIKAADGGGSSRSAGGDVRRRAGCKPVTAEATASIGLLAAAVVAVAAAAASAAAAVVVAAEAAKGGTQTSQQQSAQGRGRSMRVQRWQWVACTRRWSSTLNTAMTAFRPMSVVPPCS
jgi:hypothetical protein